MKRAANFGIQVIVLAGVELPETNPRAGFVKRRLSLSEKTIILEWITLGQLDAVPPRKGFNHAKPRQQWRDGVR